MKKTSNTKGNGKKGFARTPNNGRNHGGVTAKRIDVDSIYRQLKAALDRRAKLQEEHDRVWAVVQRNNVSRRAELDRISTKIGEETHKINQLVSQLCQYRKTHRAMNLAYDSIGREITRIERIVEKQKRVIREVDAGRSSLIRSNGVTHCDTTNLKSYVALKQKQLEKLRGWQNHVARYRVA